MSAPPRLPGRHRVPVVLQMTISDCGAACLAMILRHHGHHTTLANCRERTGIGRDGVTARRLADAARSFGLRTHAFVADPSTIEQVPLPAVAHWEDAHFVVVERITGERVEIMDPALGRRRISRAEFARSLGSAVLAFEPGPRLEPRGPDPLHERAALPAALRGAFVGCRSNLAAAVAASLLLQVLGLALPIAVAIVIDRIVSPRDPGLIPALGAGVITITLIHLAVAHVRAAALVRLQRRVDGAIMRRIFGHLLSLPLPFFQQRAGGDLMQRLGGSVVIRELVTTQALTAVLDGMFMTVYLVLLLATDPVLGGVVAALGLAQIGLLASTRTRAQQLHQQHLLAQSRSQSMLFETLSGMATVKATGAERRLFDTWSARFSTEIDLDARQNHLDAMVENTTTALRVLAPLLLVWIGAGQVLDGTHSLGAIIAVQYLAMAFLLPLGGLIANVQRLQAARAHLERLRDVLDAAPEQPEPARRATPRLRGQLELHSVSYRYDTGSPQVLRDISVTIEPGQKVGLVGPSGSGKSTLGMLLLGLYPPDQGEIRYDGIPLADLDPRTVRSQFGVVLQEPFVFGDSIRHNIAGNNPDLPLERIAAAARVAALDDDIARMPMGYETRLGDGGNGLSGGQRQRLAIARAVAADPVVFLMDEATSHLDVPTEKRVDSNLNILACTRIVVAHRASTVRNADLILVLDDGQIVERGRHDELIAQCGLYAALAGESSTFRGHAAGAQPNDLALR